MSLHLRRGGSQTVSEEQRVNTCSQWRLAQSVWCVYVPHSSQLMPHACLPHVYLLTEAARTRPLDHSSLQNVRVRVGELMRLIKTLDTDSLHTVKDAYVRQINMLVRGGEHDTAVHT